MLGQAPASIGPQEVFRGTIRSVAACTVCSAYSYHLQTEPKQAWALSLLSLMIQKGTVMMINEVLRVIAGSPKPDLLRHQLQTSTAPEVVLRRAIIGASIVGIGAMAATTLFQTGVVKHLPDPPLKDVDSDQVNASREAYSYGTPDSPLSILSHAVNIVLTTAGGEKRASKAPWLPIAALLASVPAALTAAQYLFYQMPVKERRWCGYCVTDALTHISTLGFTVFEASESLKHLAKRLKRSH
jgi:uncharacterized membrane protein